MKVAGFTGGLRVVTEWATRKRKEEGAETRDKRPGKAPSARRIAQMMTTDRDKVSKTVARTVAIIQEAVPDLTRARDLLDRFHRIIQHRKDQRLEQWIEDAKPRSHEIIRVRHRSGSGRGEERRSLSHGRMARPKDRTQN